MRTLHSQKLFSSTSLTFFHHRTIISSQSVSLLFPFLSTPLTTQQKERRQLRVNQSNFPSGFPSALLPSVLAAAVLRMFQDNTAGVTHQAPATCVCCCDCHRPVLLLPAFTRTSAGTASSHQNCRHTAELPGLQMPFSAGKLATHPLVRTVSFTNRRFQDLRGNTSYFEWPVYSQETPSDKRLSD